ncbi:hypothetical protein PPEP_a2084 [Pseudoalteromonas peptidolytica F12-50-A1]|uniref:Uncharacterized protein n=1 Tax=Pseudoalteromonas peptidolytica F12-50-A1 TaxID=1315280 RepID=A0A8I0T516_9GAMM|nr:hypothetical protein [Pseudoalteromonas peptidolytica F12-50-A1]
MGAVLHRDIVKISRCKIAPTTNKLITWVGAVLHSDFVKVLAM